MSHIDRNEYAELAGRLFARIDELNDMGFRFGDLGVIERAVIEREPLHSDEAEQWKEVFDFVLRVSPGHQRDSFAMLDGEYRRLTTVPRSEKTAVSIVSYDAGGNQIVSSDRVRIANQVTPIDPFAVEGTSSEENETFFRFRHAGRLWSVMDPGADNTTTSTFLSSAQTFLPVGSEGEFTLVGGVHTTAFLYRVLKRKGYYAGVGGNDVTIEGVRFTGDSVPSSWPGFLRKYLTFPAYSVQAAENRKWAPLVQFTPNPGNDEVVQISLNEGMTPEIAIKALNSLQFIAESLKQMGIAMNTWENVRVDLKTGDVRLGEEDRPILLEAARFQDVYKDPFPVIGGAHYFPNLVAYASGGDDILNGERELKLIIDLLSGTGFTMMAQKHWRASEAVVASIFNMMRLELFPDRDQFIEAAVHELSRFALSTRNEHLASVVDCHSGKLMEIADYYYRCMDEEGEGIYVFFTGVLPQILYIFEPEDYVEVALAYIEEARAELLQGHDVEDHWVNTVERLSNMDLRITRKKGDGGSQSGSIPGGGGLSGMGGLGGGEIGQARSACGYVGFNPQNLAETNLIAAASNVYAASAAARLPMAI